MNTGAKRASIILGVFMAIVLIGSTFLQIVGQNSGTITNNVQPTATVAPTFPPPQDAAAFTYDQFYLHPSGIFAIAQPSGFVADQPNSSPNLAQINMVNNASLSVVDAYVEDPGVPIASADLNPRFTQEVLAQSWSRFQNWQELSRRTDEAGNLIIDFSVRLSGQTYVARQRVWTDGQWIYVVRVLAPDNATDFLVTVLDRLAETVTPFTQFAGTPFNWTAFYDPVSGHILRYLPEFTVADSAPGRPASLRGVNGEQLAIRAATGQVADETAARDWLARANPNAEVLSVSPTTRGEASGFSVAYSTRTADGDPISGFAVLLNGPNGVLHSADLRFNAERVDLNASAAALVPTVLEATAEVVVEATSEVAAATDPLVAGAQAGYDNLSRMMETFSLLPSLNLSPDSLPATPTPRPTVALTPESTVEATSEATAESTFEVDLEETPNPSTLGTVEVTLEMVMTDEAALEAEATAGS